MFAKQLVISVVKKAFSLLGYEVTFTQKFKEAGSKSYTLVDKNMWEPYFVNNPMMQLYSEGLAKARIGWSDNFYKQLRFYSLQELVYYVIERKLKGDYVECGVWKGQSAYIIASILSENEFIGKFHIFDSFEGGLSDKVEEDSNLRFELTEEQIKEESELYSSSESEVISCLTGFPFTQLYNGWIPDRFNEIGNRAIVFVHIDVDLYQPTLDSLNFFYPRLVDGGVIVCDDYGVTQFPGAKRAVDEFLRNNACKMFYEVPMGSCFIIK